MRAEQLSRSLVVSTLLLFMGCVPCKHPLSDEKSSKIDERLIGEWRFFHGDKPDPVSGSIFVGRVKGSETTLEAVQCDVDKEGHVVVERVPSIRPRSVHCF